MTEAGNAQDKFETPCYTRCWGSYPKPFGLYFGVNLNRLLLVKSRPIRKTAIDWNISKRLLFSPQFAIIPKLMNGFTDILHWLQFSFKLPIWTNGLKHTWCTLTNLGNNGKLRGKYHLSCLSHMNFLRYDHDIVCVCLFENALF